MASIHQLTDAPALGHLLVVVLVDRLNRPPLEQDRPLACVPGQRREIVDADIDGGVSSIVRFLFDLGNLIDKLQINLTTMRDDAYLLEHSLSSSCPAVEASAVPSVQSASPDSRGTLRQP